MTDEVKKIPAISFMSKKKYNDIKKNFENVIDDEEKVKELLKMLCEILKFDKNIGLYNPEQGKKNYEKIKKKAVETGLSTYVLSGRKKQYEKERELKKKDI
jgi:hypothetical protein